MHPDGRRWWQKANAFLGPGSSGGPTKSCERSKSRPNIFSCAIGCECRKTHERDLFITNLQLLALIVIQMELSWADGKWRSTQRLSLFLNTKEQSQQQHAKQSTLTASTAPGTGPRFPQCQRQLGYTARN